MGLMRNMDLQIIQPKKNQFNNFSSNIFFMAFFCYLIAGIITWSQLSYIPFFITVSKMLVYFSVILLCCKLLATKYTYSSFFIITVLFIFNVVYFVLTKGIYKDVLVTILFIIGAQNVSFEKIIKIYIMTVITAIIVLFLLVKISFIVDITYSRDNGLRHSFGFVYPLVGGSYSLFAGLSIVYLTMSERIKSVSKTGPILTVLGVLFVLCYSVYTARNASIILLIGIILFIFPSTMKIFKKKWLLIGSVPLIALINFIMPNIYSMNYNLFVFFNKLLSGRLVLEQTALQMYPIKLFGQYIPQVGVAGNPGMSLNYFYIDSSFFRLLLMYGAIFFFLWILSQIMLIYRFWKSDFTLSFILVLIAIFGSFDNSMIVLYFNPFILAIMSKKRNKAFSDN